MLGVDAWCVKLANDMNFFYRDITDAIRENVYMIIYGRIHISIYSFSGNGGAFLSRDAVGGII